MKKIDTSKLVITGMMAALVMIFTFFKITIPLGPRATMIHMGNVACIMAAILLGPYRGGLAAGIGSFLFDLLDPIFITSAPFSLIFKFIMAFICGKIAYSKNKNGENAKINIFAAFIGLFFYIILHAAKGMIVNVYFLNMNFIAASVLMSKSIFFSIINAILAAFIAVPLSGIIKKYLKRYSTLPF